MKNTTRKCLKCGTRKKITRHHIWPQRFFQGQGPVELLWRDDHDELELLIPFKPRISKRKYLKILNDFIGDGYEKRKKGRKKGNRNY